MLRLIAWKEGCFKKCETQVQETLVSIEENLCFNNGSLLAQALCTYTHVVRAVSVKSYWFSQALCFILFPRYDNVCNKDGALFRSVLAFWGQGL